MEKILYKKYLVTGVILLLVGIIIVPGISGYFEKTNFIQNENRLNDLKIANILPTIYPSSKWKQEAKLIASDGESNNAFGYSVFLDGDTALIIASRLGDLKVAQLLIEAGTDVNAKNDSRETALSIAEYYLQKKIEDAKNYASPKFHIRAEYEDGYGNIVELLIEAGAKEY